MRPLPRKWWEDLKPVNTCETTNRILEMVDEGLLDAKAVLLMALKWMSEDEVKAMAKANELLLEEEADGN